MKISTIRSRSVDPQDDEMIVLHVDKSDNPPLPSSIAFQIQISIRNTTV